MQYRNVEKIGCISMLVLSICIISFAIFSIYALSKRNEPEITEEDSNQIIEVQEIQDTLTDWEIMKMALIEVESEFKSCAISSKGATGIYQLTETYIDDVNRIVQTSFNIDDALDDENSNYMFEVYQQHYNPNHYIEKAIKIHNPKAGTWYIERVFFKMELIKRREQIRQLVRHYAD